MADSAGISFELLKSLGNIPLRGEQRARYALLYTQSQYKCYIDETNDSLINIAVSYYSNGNDYERRFKSYYYQGCIYMNSQVYTSAALAFAKAENIIGNVNDTLTKGLFYTQMGNLYYSIYDWGTAMSYFGKAANEYGLVGRKNHLAHALCDVGICSYQLGDYEYSYKILNESVSMAEMLSDTTLELSCLNYLLNISMKSPSDFNLSDSLYDKILSVTRKRPINCSMSMTIAELNLMENQFEPFLLNLYKAMESNPDRIDSVRLYFLESVYFEKLSQYQNSLQCLKEALSIQRVQIDGLLSQQVPFVQKDYFKTNLELEMLKAQIREKRDVILLLTSILIIGSLLLLYLMHRKASAISIENKLLQIQTLTEQLRLANDKYTETNKEAKKLLHEQYRILEVLLAKYYELPGKEDSKRAKRLYESFQSAIDNYMSEENVCRLSQIVNSIYGNITEELISVGIGVNSVDYKLMLLSILGFNAKSISILLNITTNNVYTKRSRILQKLKVNGSSRFNDVLCI